MAIDRARFAQECIRQGIFFGVEPHYLLGVAQLRSGISDDSSNGQIGPFRLKQAEWDANSNDDEFDVHFTPTQISSPVRQCAVFALMTHHAFDAFVSKNSRNPTAKELYLQQRPEADTATFAADFQKALDDTAALVDPAADAVLDDPQSVRTISNPDQSTIGQGGANDKEVATGESHTALAGKAGAIIAECENEWPANKGDCSAFVRAVAHGLGVQLTGNANQIVDQISGPQWHRLAGGGAAKIAADGGELVIGGLKGSDQSVPSEHGHVVVIVAGELDPIHHAYPTAYWGRLGGVGMKNKPINFAWRDPDRDHVIYAAFVG